MDYKNKYFIADAHVHVFPHKIAAKAAKNISGFYDLPMECNEGSIESLVKANKEAGVNISLICSPATTPSQTVGINRFIAETSRAEKSVFPFGSVHPLSDDVERDIKSAKEAGLKGLKLHPDFQNFEIDSAFAMDIYLAAQKYDMPILMHMGDARYSGSSPKRLAHVLKYLPDLKVIAAHLGGFQRWDESFLYLKGHRNLKFDTSSTLRFLSPEKSREIIKAFGTENVMFGSDFPMSLPETEIKRFLSLGFDESDNARILGENFLEFFGLDRKDLD
jgi:predicted TIM-barrel fold metal-dependent hydrolase